MSIPLPNIPTASSSYYLDPDERFEVFQVKAAERPHLLGVDDDSENNDNDDLPPPLLDGCDVPAWRQEHLVGSLSSDLQGVLRIGAGSTLFRRDSQWPCIDDINKTTCPWEVLRKKLLVPPLEDIPRVDYQDVSQKANGGTTKFALEWERRNVPILIEGCTEGWRAMPIYEKDFEQANVWNGGGKGGWT